MTPAISILLIAVAAGKPGTTPRLPRLVTTPIAHTPNFTVTAVPAVINFTGTNPGTTPVVPGSATATITWTVTSGNKWTIYITAASSTFANCPQVPVSAVTVTCQSINSSGGTNSCAAPFPLSTTATVVGNGSKGGDNYSVLINFTLADSWRYIAETNPACSLSLTYLVDFPQ